MTTLTAKLWPPRAGEMSRSTKIPAVPKTTLVVLLALLGLALCVPSLARAEFVRPYVTQLTGTPTGPLGEQVPFGKVACVAVDSGEGGITPGNLWVGDSTNSVIDEFSSSVVFLRQLFGLPVNGCAFDDSTHELRSVGPREWAAVDDSGGMYAGDVYLDLAEPEKHPTGSVERVEPGGAPVDFTCSEPGAGEYVEGNRLVGKPEWEGKPAEAWRREAIEGVAVSSSGGSAGDLYVINNAHREIDVFTSAGCFVRAISTTRMVERDGRREVEELFVSELKGVAVDPSDGDVLVKGAVLPSGSAIAEFSSSGGFLGEFVGRSKSSLFGSKSLLGGIAVGAGGELYVAADEPECGSALTGGECEKHEEECELRTHTSCGRHVVDVFGRGAFYPGAVTGGTSGARLGAVTLTGVVRGAENNAKEDLVLAECKFEYVPEAVFKVSRFSVLGSEETVPCAQGLVGQRLKEEDYPVSAEVGGLEEGTVYRYRVVSSTAPGAPEYGGVREGAAESFAAPGLPVVGDAFVTGVSSSWADFHATIDPVGLDATYRFEYLSAAGYAADGDSFAGAVSAVSVPASGGDVGAGSTGVSVGVQASGLSAGTSYRFRVVADNAVGVAAGGVGAEGMFATSPAVVPGLPDGRVYEMLTPPNKEDSEDLFGGEEVFSENVDLGYSSEDGNHFLLAVTTAAFGSFPATGNNPYVFSRGADGWSFQPAASPGLGVQSGAAEVFDPADFSVIGFNDQENLGGASKLVLNLVGPPGGPYTTIAAGAKATPAEAHMVGASADLSHVILESADHELAAGDETQEAGSQALYEWAGGGECTQKTSNCKLVNIGPEGEVLQCGAVLGQGGGQSIVAGSTHGAVSDDGSKVFFTAPDPEATGPGCWNGAGKNPPELYVREKGESTVEVSLPEEGVEVGGANPLKPAIYVGASTDGSKVFFMTETELTQEAVSLKLHDMELYEYNTDPGGGEAALVRVSRGDAAAGQDGVAGGVQDVPAVAGDGSTVYFNASGDLAPGGQQGGLYRYDTETGETAYVAPTGGYPGYGNSTLRSWYESIVGQFAGLDLRASYYATANGEFLVFGSSQDITGYDSNGKEEIYRYDALDGSTVCVSCNPNGAPAAYGASFTRSAVKLNAPAGTPPRAISEDGEYVFFDTRESLLAADTNDRIDVYEWHENPATHEGAIGSISSGQSATNDFFLDSSPDGKNVFFGTQSKLVPADTDEEGDLYDARIEGGFPAPIGAGPCEGDACDNPPAAPVFQTPTSLSFAGPGNVSSVAAPPPPVVKKTVKCAKPTKLSHGKCVKPKKSKKAKKSAYKSAKGRK